ncbi:MAG: porin family protein [Cyclobacteriaceae bacterium]
MKKLLIVCLMLVGVASSRTALAQVQFSLGIKGGVNFANLDVSSSIGDNYKNRTGFHGGAFALFKVTAFAVQPELIFSQQGSKVNINSQDIDANFSYLNIPIMAKFYLPLGLNLQLGPQFGFLTTAESDYNPISGAQTSTDLKEYYKNSDVSIGMGIGWDLPMKLSIDARYNLGITEIEDNASLSQTKNQVFQISLGYKLFKFGK